MSLFKRVWLVTMWFSLAGCTTGRLEYITPNGKHKTACETEYTWAPSIDKYAVEYVLAYCAKRATEKGNTVLDSTLLSIDLKVPNPPAGFSWSHELAKKRYQQKQLTDKEYGYLIAYLDLGHDSLSPE
jgi:hypothetical protein